jgi:hypothetical protein
MGELPGLSPAPTGADQTREHLPAATGDARQLAPEGTSRAATGGVRRVAGVAVLLAVAAVGLRARGTFSHAPNLAALGASRSVLAVILAACEGLALIAFIIVLAMARPHRPKQETEDEPWRPPLPWWAKVLAVTAALALLITPFAVLFTRKAHKAVPRPSLARPGLPPGTGKLTTPPPSSAWPAIAGLAIALAIVIALAVASQRRRRARAPAPWAGRRTRLIESLTAGSEALAAGTEPRAAIIACYTAMEHGFAAAGSAPADADTPAEVLHRAAHAGIVRSGAPEVLAGLFRRARYSDEPMTGADSGAAATALAQMRADLEDLVESAAGTPS